MTTAITGNAGINFSITETDAAALTGTKTQLHQPADAIRDMTFLTTDLVASWSGYVGTTEANLVLNALANITATGCVIKMVNATAPLASAVAVRMLVFYNKHASQNITIKAAAAGNSFLTASEQITLLPGKAVALVYTTAKAISTDINIGILGAGALTDIEIYALCTTA